MKFLIFSFYQCTGVLRLYLLWVYSAVMTLTCLQAAFLHDTVEDTDTSFDELEQVFGEEVKNLVAECSDDKSLPKEERKRLQVRTSIALGTLWYVSTCTNNTLHLEEL